ncbi:MAG: sulfite exporter TauE/SafE family protein [Pseudomonadota bacterium]
MSLLALAAFLAIGAAAGLLAGLLGVGGGLVIVAALAWILPGQGVPPGAVIHVALATSLATILATSLSSTRAHLARGSVMWPTVRALVPGLLVGGAAGALVADRLPDLVLRLGVAAFCFAAAIQLATRRVVADGDAGTVPAGRSLTLWGGMIGAVSALVGIGGGSMTVPLLIRFGALPVRAVGTSAACGFAIALASAAGYAWGGRDAADLPAATWGYIHLPAAAAIAAASVLLAPAGAALAHRLRGPVLARVFAGFLVLMGTAVLAAARGARARAGFPRTRKR